MHAKTPTTNTHHKHPHTPKHSAGAAGVLSAITALKKLCNHPKLIYDGLVAATAGNAGGGGRHLEFPVRPNL